MATPCFYNIYCRGELRSPVVGVRRERPYKSIAIAQVGVFFARTQPPRKIDLILEDYRRNHVASEINS